MAITIVPMTEADMDGKGYVHHRSWQETYRGLIDDSYLDGMTLEKCVKIAHRWSDNILVAKDGERIVGFAGYGAYRDDSLTDTGEIYAIYLLSEYHGQKIGYALMNAAVEKLRDYPAVAVWVLKGNDRAISFYERYGFVFDGTEADVMLGTPNKELRMILRKK